MKSQKRVLSIFRILQIRNDTFKSLTQETTCLYDLEIILDNPFATDLHMVLQTKQENAADDDK